MPNKKRFRFYDGKPVKRMRRGEHGLILTFLAPVAGVAGTQITVSEADWKRLGEWRTVEAPRMDDMREIVKKQAM